MDCVIPGPLVRSFCSALSCLTKIGKEIYFEFDYLDGLTLRALNDGKSVVGSFVYQPSYFVKCSPGPARLSSHGNDKKKKNSKRKNNNLRKKQQQQKRKRGRRNGDSDDDDYEEENEDGDDENEDEDDGENTNNQDRWCVRISIKALTGVIRARKDVLSLQVISRDEDHLSFEYQLQRPDGVIVRVNHIVGVMEAQGVAAVVQTDHASEIIVQPHVVMNMLDPLKRAMEVALLVNERHKLVSIATFSQDDMTNDVSSLLSGPASIKTETSIGYDELLEIDYVGHSTNVTAGVDDPIPPPPNLSEHVVLVFALKEFKAMLQFCLQKQGSGGGGGGGNAAASAAAAAAAIDYYPQQELPVTMSFYWGGKPLVLRAGGTPEDKFSVELVMATLDHKLLKHMKMSSAAAAAAAAAAVGGDSGPSGNTSTGDRQ